MLFTNGEAELEGDGFGDLPERPATVSKVPQLVCEEAQCLPRDAGILGAHGLDQRRRLLVRQADQAGWHNLERGTTDAVIGFRVASRTARPMRSDALAATSSRMGRACLAPASAMASARVPNVRPARSKTMGSVCSAVRSWV